MTGARRAPSPEAAAEILVRRARPTDLASIESLLEAVGLTREGAADAFDCGVAAFVADRLIGCAAVERFEPAGVLRSVAVAPDMQGRGLGRRVVEAAERLAVDDGVEESFLLTQTAPDFFARLGYTSIDRAEAPQAVRESIEFQMVACASAAVMRRRLRPSSAEADGQSVIGPRRAGGPHQAGG